MHLSPRNPADAAALSGFLRLLEFGRRAPAGQAAEEKAANLLYLVVKDHPQFLHRGHS